ncbi:hypothetical protein [Ensifer adhaerens]|uniref:hypothetical protein n=1 Tax=Ensifer adhaerens TaxID=106592 RepID=UPI000FD7E12A|nr:hypothetical protein [Ensifer adhaerens]MDF8352822.1 hypothetical protein [Ensifer adhaerens]THA65913.1 hypothetical protein E5176_13240 [Ensifer adhaerens]
MIEEVAVDLLVGGLLSAIGLDLRPQEPVVLCTLGLFFFLRLPFFDVLEDRADQIGRRGGGRLLGRKQRDSSWQHSGSF